MNLDIFLLIIEERQMSKLDKLGDLVIESRGIKKSTWNIHRRNVKRVMKHLGVDEFDCSIFDKENFNKIKEMIDEMKIHSRKSIVQSILVCLSPDKRRNPPEELAALYMKYSGILKDNNKVYMDAKVTQEKNVREEKNWVSYDQLMKKFEGYMSIAESVKGEEPSSHKTRELQKALIAGLYVIHPPRRLDYAVVEFIDGDEYDSLRKKDKMKKHYLVMDDEKYYFSFGGEATKSATTDVVKVDLDERLKWLVDEIVNDIEDGREFLFVNTRGNRFDTNSFGKFLRTIFNFDGKRVGANMLRHIYLSEFFKNDTDYMEKKELADKMNHSVAVQQMVYRKKLN